MVRILFCFCQIFRVGALGLALGLDLAWFRVGFVGLGLGLGSGLDWVEAFSWFVPINTHDHTRKQARKKTTKRNVCGALFSMMVGRDRAKAPRGVIMACYAYYTVLLVSYDGSHVLLEQGAVDCECTYSVCVPGPCHL